MGQNNIWMLGNVKFISRDILVSTRNKFRISIHPCILYIQYTINLKKWQGLVRIYKKEL